MTSNLLNNYDETKTAEFCIRLDTMINKAIQEKIMPINLLIGVLEGRKLSLWKLLRDAEERLAEEKEKI